MSMHQAEEDILVLAAQAGNQKAFSLLVKHYQKPLVRFAFKMSQNSQIAQDAVQDAWLKMTGSIHRLDDPRVFRSWLYRSVRWQVIDRMRNYSAETRLFSANQETDLNPVVEPEQPESDVEKIENDQWIYKAISRLAPIEKQIINLFYIDDLSLKEISIVLAIPVGTVKSRLNRSRNQLKQELTNNGVSDEY